MPDAGLWDAVLAEVRKDVPTEDRELVAAGYRPQMIPQWAG